MENVVYHYTDEAGLRGILDSQCLWAVNFEDLNDKTEVQDILHHINLYKRTSQGSKKIPEFCAHVEEVISDFYLREVDKKADFYVTCFTSDPLSHDLWQNASKNGNKQYAICFSMEQLNHLTSCESGFFIGAENLQQVIYKKEHKRRALMAWRKEFESLISSRMRDNIAHESVVLRFICLPALFKNPKEWQQQKEWRIIIRHPKSILIPRNGRVDKTVHNPTGTKRYIKLFNDPAVANYAGLSGAIRGIIIGQNGTERTAREILGAYNLSHIPLSHAYK